MERQVCPFQNVSIEGFTPRKCAQDCARREAIPGEPRELKILTNEGARAGDLPWFARLADPKSGASANSATFANLEFLLTLNSAQTLVLSTGGCPPKEP